MSSPCAAGGMAMACETIGGPVPVSRTLSTALRLTATQIPAGLNAESCMGWDLHGLQGPASGLQGHNGIILVYQSSAIHAMWSALGAGHNLGLEQPSASYEGYSIIQPQSQGPYSKCQHCARSICNYLAVGGGIVIRHTTWAFIAYPSSCVAAAQAWTRWCHSW